MINMRATSERRNKPTVTGVIVHVATEGGGYLDASNGFNIECYAYLLTDTGEVVQVPLAGLKVEATKADALPVDHHDLAAACERYLKARKGQSGDEYTAALNALRAAVGGPS